MKQNYLFYSGEKNVSLFISKFCLLTWGYVMNFVEKFGPRRIVKYEFLTCLPLLHFPSHGMTYIILKERK